VDFFRDNPGEPVPEETFTHSHLSWSSIIPYLLPPSFTIHGILPIQSTHMTVFSTISIQVFFGLPLGLAPFTSYFIHFFTQSLSSFHNTCPYHFHSLSRLIRSSSVSAIITRSSAYNNSHGKATLNSLDYVSMTITNSKGLNAEPWCIPTSKLLLLP